MCIINSELCLSVVNNICGWFYIYKKWSVITGRCMCHQLPQLNQKLSVASVAWWINPTHSHKCNYFICQRLGRPHWAPCAQKLPAEKWKERSRHFAFLFISSKVCPVQLNHSYNHSVRAEVIISSIPFGPWRTLKAGYEFHIIVDTTPIHNHLHIHTHTHKILLYCTLQNKGMHYSTTC